MKCLKNLSIIQLVKLSQRFDLNPQYKNPRKRKAALIRSLREYWKTNSIGECSICWEEIEPKKLCVTPCAHIFCFDCLIPYIRQSEKCPLCRAECSYAHILSKLFRIPELAIVLKRLINVSRQEEWIEEVEEEEIEEEEESIEETRTIIYHVNIYIIMQKNLENLHSFVTIFVAVFFSYYYYLLFLRKGLQLFNLCINVITIFWVIYYALS
jgi:hypothetical protein